MLEMTNYGLISMEDPTEISAPEDLTTSYDLSSAALANSPTRSKKHSFLNITSAFTQAGSGCLSIIIQVENVH